MGARWYDPEIGRWLSPDTIVPDPKNPQSLNRFGYVYNNPLKHTDPSGHCAKDDAVCEAYRKYLLDQFGIHLEDDTAVWSADEAKLVYETLYDVATKFWEVVPWRDASDLMKTVWKDVVLLRVKTTETGGPLTPNGWGGNLIDFPDSTPTNGMWDTSDPMWSRNIIAHELGHAWDLRQSIGGPISMGLVSQVKGDSSRCLGAFSCWGAYDPGSLEEPVGAYSRRNPGEDWATSFAQFVEPYFGTKANWNALGPRRSYYVRIQIALLVSNDQ